MTGAVFQGVLAGFIFLFGVLAIRLLPKYKWLAAGVLLVLITPLALGGFWFSSGQLGISDWDYYFSLHTTHRNTLLNYGELPHWNPYTCGGTAGLADPEFRFFTPTFLLQLAFGVPIGLRLAVFVSVATIAVGMLLLGKRLGLSVYAAALAALPVAFGSVNLLEIVEGHPNIFAAMYIPWIFWAWLAAYRLKNPKWVLICAIFLALTFFQGGIYLLMYTGLAFLGLMVLAPRRKEAVLTSVHAGVWALGLAAVKLIPVLLWLGQFPDKAYASSAFTLPYLHEIFLGRHLHGAGEIIANQGSGWHEYGAYIGLAALLLAFVGLKQIKRPAVRGLFISAILAILLSSAGPALKPLFDHASFLPRSNISRFILFAVIPIGLLAGFGLDTIRKSLEIGNWKLEIGRYKIAPLSIIPLLLIGLTAGDLLSLSYPLSEQAFVLPRTVEAIAPAPAPIAYTADEYKFGYNGEEYTRAYEAILKGYGSLSYCSVLGPSSAVRTIHDEEDKAVLSISTGGAPVGSFELVRWSPNVVTAAVDIPVQAAVVLNTNYAKGWQVYTEPSRSVNGAPAQEIGNRVGVTLPAGKHLVTFAYKTPGFAVGTAVSLITLAAVVVLLTRRKPPIILNKS